MFPNYYINKNLEGENHQVMDFNETRYSFAKIIVFCFLYLFIYFNDYFKFALRALNDPPMWFVKSLIYLKGPPINRWGGRG